MESIPSLETVATLVEQAAQHFHRLFEYLAYLVGFFVRCEGLLSLVWHHPGPATLTVERPDLCHRRCEPGLSQ